MDASAIQNQSKCSKYDITYPSVNRFKLYFIQFCDPDCHHFETESLIEAIKPLSIE